MATRFIQHDVWSPSYHQFANTWLSPGASKMRLIPEHGNYAHNARR
jgi:hypothetical protein